MVNADTLYLYKAEVLSYVVHSHDDGTGEFTIEGYIQFDRADNPVKLFSYDEDGVEPGYLIPRNGQYLTMFDDRWVDINARICVKLIERDGLSWDGLTSNDNVVPANSSQICVDVSDIVGAIGTVNSFDFFENGDSGCRIYLKLTLINFLRTGGGGNWL